MIQSANGLILRTRPLTETSLIVHWLTPDLGRLSTVAKGARRPKSPFAGKLDIGYAADFTFSRSRRSELHPLREIRLTHLHLALRHDLAWLQQAADAIAWIEQTTEIETPLPGIFHLLSDLLDFLPTQPPQRRTLFAFELKLLAELGQSPDLTASKLTRPTRQLAADLTTCAWSELPRLAAAPAQVRELQQFLHRFLAYHLGRPRTMRRPADLRHSGDS